jgi:hypothetical protein
VRAHASCVVVATVTGNSPVSMTRDRWFSSPFVWGVTTTGPLWVPLPAGRVSVPPNVKSPPSPSRFGSRKVTTAVVAAVGSVVALSSVSR